MDIKHSTRLLLYCDPAVDLRNPGRKNRQLQLRHASLLPQRSPLCKCLCRIIPFSLISGNYRATSGDLKLVIEPLFEADFMPCSFGFRPKKTPRMALSAIVQSINDGYSFVVDVDLKSYFDTISHELLLELVERRVGDIQVLRLIRAWLKAGVMEEGKVTHPDRGSPQGGVISRS